MADRVVSEAQAGVPEIDSNLEAVLLYTLNQARERMEQGEEMVPFTALAVKDTLFMESHPAETAEECFNQARHTVQDARGATCYALCYDGYVDTDEGQMDTLIAEGGLPGELEGHAIGLLYCETDEGFEFESDAVYIGKAPNFMMGLGALDDEDEADDDDRENDREDESDDEHDGHDTDDADGEGKHDTDD